MKRKIITIDEEKCNGCGLCIPNCHEQAIKIINGKARLVNDVFCDGLGACLGECPQGALRLEEREAQPFDEKIVLENIEQNKNVVKKNREAISPGPVDFFVTIKDGQASTGCPGSAHAAFTKKMPPAVNASPENIGQSELAHWPIQLHLVNPAADFFSGKDVVLSADCVAYSLSNFHDRFLKGKSLAIACPKLDRDIDVYIEKIRRMADEAKINTLTVIMMQVPCCRGLLQIAQAALQQAARKVPLKAIILSTQGEVLSEDWV